MIRTWGVGAWPQTLKEEKEEKKEREEDLNSSAPGEELSKGDEAKGHFVSS